MSNRALGSKRTELDGHVSWSWIIGGRTGAGTGKLHVLCGNSDDISTDIEVR
jgi:hypothetical protein